VDRDLLHKLVIVGAHIPCFLPFWLIVYCCVDSWCYIVCVRKGRPTVKPLRYRSVRTLGTCQLAAINGLPTSWSKDRLQKLNISAEGHEILSVLWNSEGYYHFHNIPPRIPALIKLTQPPHSFPFIKDPFQLLSSHLCLAFPRYCCTYINNHKRNDIARILGYDRFINVYEICV